MSTVPVTLSTIEIHLNSVESTPKAKRTTLDIKDFYYRTPLTDFKYGHLPLELVPDEIKK